MDGTGCNGHRHYRIGRRAGMKRLKVVLGVKEVERLYQRKELLVRTPKGEVMEIAFSLTVKKPTRYSLFDEFLKEL